MAEREKKKTVTKKYLARVERERIQRRIITAVTIFVAAVVVLLIAAGFIIEGVIKPSQPIVQVDDTTITTRQLQSWVRYQRYNLVNQYANYWQMKQSFGDPNSASFFDSYLFQLQAQLQSKETVGLSAQDALIEDIFIRREAEKLGIEVSKEEVDAWIQENVFNFYLSGTPTPSPTEVVVPTSTLSPVQMTLVAPPPTATLAATETTTETVEIEPTATATTAAESNEEIAPTESLPTPTEYTEKALKGDLQNFLRNLKTYAKVSEEQFYYIIESQLLREKVLKALTADLVPEEEQVWARHILFQDEETGEQQAREISARLQAGEDFSSLVDEYTEVNASNPEETPTIRFEDLGWFGRGRMVIEFETAAYALRVGEISEPVQSSFGWHVIQVVGHEVRPLSALDFEQLQEKAFSEWVAEKRAESVVDLQPDWLDAVPMDPDIPDQIKLDPFQ